MEVLDAAILQKFIILVKVNFCQQALYNFKMHSGVCRIIPYCHRIKTTYLTSFFILLCEAGICNSQPQALCLAIDPGPKFVFTGPGTKFVFTSPGPQFVFTGPGPQVLFTGSDLQLVFTPNLYLPAQPGLSLHIPTLSPQFVFTGPGL